MPPTTTISRPGCARTTDRALWAVTAACVAVTFWFSFGASPPGAGLFPGADKMGHAIAYFATTLSFLFVAVWRPVRGEGRFPRLRMWFPAAAVAVGVMIEILQGMTPTRTAQFYDVVAEAIGAAAALAVHSLVHWSFAARLAQERPRV